MTVKYFIQEHIAHISNEQISDVIEAVKSNGNGTINIDGCGISYNADYNPEFYEMNMDSLYDSIDDARNYDFNYAEPSLEYTPYGIDIVEPELWEIEYEGDPWVNISSSSDVVDGKYGYLSYDESTGKLYI